MEFESFVGTEEADLLRRIADWLEAESDRVLIGLWSTGFAEPWQICLQVVATRESDEETSVGCP